MRFTGLFALLGGGCLLLALWMSSSGLVPVAGGGYALGDLSRGFVDGGPLVWVLAGTGVALLIVARFLPGEPPSINVRKRRIQPVVEVGILQDPPMPLGHDAGVGLSRAWDFGLRSVLCGAFAAGIVAGVGMLAYLGWHWAAAAFLLLGAPWFCLLAVRSAQYWRRREAGADPAETVCDCGGTLVDVSERVRRTCARCRGQETAVMNASIVAAAVIGVAWIVAITGWGR